MYRYAGDPYWITAKWGVCAECKRPIKGRRVFYYPKGRECFCDECGAGSRHAADFASCAADEYAYNNR